MAPTIENLTNLPNLSNVATTTTSSDIVTESQNLQFKTIFIGSFTTAITLVIALYWQNFIQEVINNVVPPTMKLFWMFIATVIITILGVTAIYLVYKWL